MRHPGDNFAVKARFVDGRYEEWMWVQVTSIDAETLRGTLDNEPVHLGNLKVNQAVTDAFRGVLSSISEVEARKAAIVSATSTLESTEAGLEVGTRTQVDVLTAQRQLFENEYLYLSARYDYIINGIKLYQATSGLNREAIERANTWLNPGDLLTTSNL